MGEHVTVFECSRCPRFEAAEVNGEVVTVTPRKLLLVNKQSPGDILVMTAAIEALHEQYRGHFLTAVETSCDAIFEANPWIQPRDASMEGAQRIPMVYPLVHKSGERPIHFLFAFVDMLSKFLDVPLELHDNQPRLYLSEQERSWINQVQERTGVPTPFLVINAGTKADFTAKGWGHHHYQDVVNRLRHKVLFVQIGERGHLHLPLESVMDLRGQTDTRQLIRLVYHSAGGLGPSTFLQHLCAAWKKPYFLLLGGREPVSWTAYPNQVTFSTHGLLPCCRATDYRHASCWKSRVVALDTGDRRADEEQNKSLCEMPVLDGPQPVARCMEMIRPETVAGAIEAYWDSTYPEQKDVIHA